MRRIFRNTSCSSKEDVKHKLIFCFVFPLHNPEYYYRLSFNHISTIINCPNSMHLERDNKYLEIN